MSEAPEDVPTTESDEQETEGAAQEVDLQALADKVYEMLKEDARIERERQGRRRS